MKLEDLGIELIAKERYEQVSKHGITLEYDSKINDQNQLVLAAIYLILKEFDGVDNLLAPEGWDEASWEKMCNKTYQERLVIAGALIAAEYDRVEYDRINEIKNNSQ